MLSGQGGSWAGRGGASGRGDTNPLFSWVGPGLFCIAERNRAGLREKEISGMVSEISCVESRPGRIQ